MAELSLPRTHLERMFYYLLLTRRLEERLAHTYRHEPGLIPGSAYLGWGQEAISVGASYVLEAGDWLAPSHRDLGAHLIRGITLREIFAHHFGRVDGPTRGRDGNIHFGDPRRHILVFVSHMAALLPAACGVARAFKVRGERNVILACFGDGASSQGVVHEAMNWAGVYRLPVIFLLNNNQWAISTPVEHQFAVKDLTIRAQGYGFPGHVVDGNDVLAVYQATREAVDRARRGEGPTLLECKTYRIGGHGEHDAATYLRHEEQEEWAARDPLKRFRDLLVQHGVLDASAEQALEARIKQELDDAVAFAKGSPLPEGKDCLSGVFAGERP